MVDGGPGGPNQLLGSRGAPRCWYAFTVPWLACAGVAADASARVVVGLEVAVVAAWLLVLQT